MDDNRINQELRLVSSQQKRRQLWLRASTILTAGGEAKSMELGDGVAIVEGVALAGCWIWIQSKGLSFTDLRRKAALASFVCASAAVVFDLVLTGIMHGAPPGDIRGNVYLGFFGAGILMTFLSLVLGLLGKGSPRVMSLNWCVVLLCQIALTIMIALSEAGSNVPEVRS